VSTAFECIDTACVDVVVGVNEAINEKLISIYPNPSGEAFYLNLSPEIPFPVRWAMYTVYGQKVDQGRLIVNEEVIAWHNLTTPGMYILQIFISDDSVITKRLIHQ
jgi:hypothetical protein